jgi:CBS domain-containing protein
MEIPEAEEYLQADEAKSRVLDDRMIREPISTLQPLKPVCVEKGASVAEAVRLMQEHHIGCVLVTESKRLAGIFTERDVLREVAGRKIDAETTPVDELMTSNPETLTPGDPIVYALNKMSLGGFRHVPLIDDSQRPVGIISVKDIVDYIVDFFSNEVLTIPPEPGLDVPKSPEGA